MLCKVIIVCALLANFTLPSSFVSSAEVVYEVVILNGRVIDPESRLDAVRNLGISRGTIRAINTGRLKGTALELEVGTGDVDRWYADREGRTTINYGVSVGHLAARMAAMHDPIEFLPSREAARREASDEIAEMTKQFELKDPCWSRC